MGRINLNQGETCTHNCLQSTLPRLKPTRKSTRLVSFVDFSVLITEIYESQMCCTGPVAGNVYLTGIEIMSSQDKSRYSTSPSSAGNSFPGASTSSASFSSPASQSPPSWSSGSSVMSSIISNFSMTGRSNGSNGTNLIRDYNVWMPQSM